MPLEVAMTTLYRAQVLLESEQHEALAAIAQQEGRSVSDLLREIVRQHLEDREARKLDALQAVEKLTQIRESVQERYGTCPRDLVAEVRAEREEELERVRRGEP
jgi:predicted DNA-binding protein